MSNPLKFAAHAVHGLAEGAVNPAGLAKAAGVELSDAENFRLFRLDAQNEFGPGHEDRPDILITPLDTMQAAGHKIQEAAGHAATVNTSAPTAAPTFENAAAGAPDTGDDGGCFDCFDCVIV